MVQAWYQGGISVFDWTDASRPNEIAFFDRGPVDPTRLALGGSWSVYWYNGVIVSSEIARGLDIFELTPSAFISQNEIDAAKTVRFDYFNAQGQQKFVWPPSVRAGARVRRSARALERTRVRQNLGRTIRAHRSGECLRNATPRCAHDSRHESGWRCQRLERLGQGSDAGRCGEGPGRRGSLSLP